MSRREFAIGALCYGTAFQVIDVARCRITYPTRAATYRQLSKMYLTIGANLDMSACMHVIEAKECNAKADYMEVYLQMNLLQQFPTVTWV